MILNVNVNVNVECEIPLKSMFEGYLKQKLKN